MGVTAVATAEPDDGEFVVRPTVYRLVWAEGEPHHGLVVRVRSMPMGTFLRLAPQVDELQRLRPEDLTVERVPALLEPFRVIGDHLVSWNLRTEVDGVRTPVPATFEGLLSQELPLIEAVIRAWMQASGTVAAPLERPSSPGASDEELLAALATNPLSP